MLNRSRFNRHCDALFDALDRTAGRNAPIERREIRMARGRIIAAPISGYALEDSSRLEPRPVMGLWSPLLEELTRERIEQLAQMERGRETSRMWPLLDALSGGRLSKESDFIGPPAPIEPPELSFGDKVISCHKCLAPFFAVNLVRGRRRYCSDACSAEAKKRSRHALAERHRKERSWRRLRARSNRKCETCGELFTPERSTGRFCSARCRVAAHRAGEAMAGAAY